VNVAVGAPRRVSPVAAAFFALAAAAWIATIVWAIAMDMGAEAGTMGLGGPAFVGLWTVMMAAMMLPAVVPLASLYARSVRHEPTAVVGFGLGYVIAWAVTGIAAFGLAELFDSLATEHSTAAHVVAVGAFAMCGIYQLTPLKRWCLRHCRSPFGHLLHYSAFRGATRHLRAGLHHGLLCIGCCWMLMVALVAVGVMNIPVMVGIALLISLEKQWHHGEMLARIVGVAALVFAVAVAINADLAPGLVHHDDAQMDM
jgi:predicted metal-binding membrane protein